jgi:hypothetical protein
MTGQPQQRGEPAREHAFDVDDGIAELLHQAGDIEDGHCLEGWALVMSTVGHRPDGTEVRRTYRYAPAGTTRGESEHLLSKGAAMVRTTQPHPGNFTSS